MDLTKNQTLTNVEIEEINIKILNGEISNLDIHKSIKLQLLKYAYDSIDNSKNNLIKLIDDGLITISMINNDFEIYIKQKTKNEHYIIEFLNNNETTETSLNNTNEKAESIYNKIKNFKLENQIKFVLSLENQIRGELFDMIYKNATDITIKENIKNIINRIKKSKIQIADYTESEIEYYQNIFLDEFQKILHHTDEDKILIEDKISEIKLYCFSIEQDLKFKNYEFIEARERDNTNLFGAIRYKIYLENLIANFNELSIQKNETIVEESQMMDEDISLSNIKKMLSEFKNNMNEKDFISLAEALDTYLKKGTFPTLIKPISVGRVNKKSFGWILNRIFESQGRGIEKQLLQFAQQNISLFKKDEYVEDRYRESNLYKYFTTKTK